MADFTVRQGDNFTILDTLADAEDAAVDIQGHVIKFTLIPIGGGSAVLDAVTASNEQVGTGVDGSKGKVLYSGGSATTATPGKYLASWYDANTFQTFPNGGYILFEVTADSPVASVTRFAESVDLEQRLGITFTADEHIRANTLLEVASGIIQDETKQTISLVTGDVYTRPGDYDTRVRLPERPVVSVASVVLNGVALNAVDNYYLDRDELVRVNWNSVIQDSSFGLPWAGWGFPWWNLVVTYTHGFGVIPQTVKNVCMEMVVRVWTNPGSVARETVGDVSVVYDNNRFSPAGMLMTDIEKADINKLLRRHSGSASLR